MNGSLVHDLRPDEANLAQRICAAQMWDPKSGWPSKLHKGIALHQGDLLKAIEDAITAEQTNGFCVVLLDSSSEATLVVSSC